VTKHDKDSSYPPSCARKRPRCQHSQVVVIYDPLISDRPSAAAASRRAEFLGMRRAAAEFFYGSAESQPNFSNVIYFSAQIRREHTA